jgi:hypothetical protein
MFLVDIKSPKQADRDFATNFMKALAEHHKKKFCKGNGGDDCTSPSESLASVLHKLAFKEGDISLKLSVDAANQYPEDGTKILKQQSGIDKVKVREKDLKFLTQEKTETKHIPKEQIDKNKNEVIIYIQIPKKSSEEQLLSFLKQQGWQNIPKAEEIEHSFTNSIRYYHEEDRLVASQLLEDTKRYAPNEDMRLIYLGKEYPNVKKGTLELWIKPKVMIKQ